MLNLWLDMDGRESKFLDQAEEFLTRPDIESFLSIHPNAMVAPAFTPPESWASWWDWAADVSSPNDESKWQQLWQYYVLDAPLQDAFSHIPTSLRTLLQRARRLQLCREPGREATVPDEDPRCCCDPTDYDFPSTNLPGMSPKKTHEVLCMSKYAASLLAELSGQGAAVGHVVDVGAGQVSRLLCLMAPGPPDVGSLRG
jgi:hypothetical protein